MNTRQYLVTLTHPTNFHSGSHILTVHDTAGKPGCVYVTATGFGCSRDYAVRLPWEKGLKQKDADAKGIRMFLAEHACTVVKIKPQK